MFPLICEMANNWILLYFVLSYHWAVFCKNIPQLGRFLLGLSLQKYSTAGLFTAGPFFAEISHSWVVFCWAVLCRNISPLGRLSLGCFPQKHFTARLFSAETLYCWAISYGVYFYHIDVSTVETAYGPLLSIPTKAQGIKYSEFLGLSSITFGPCIKLIVEFRFRPSKPT